MATERMHTPYTSFLWPQPRSDATQGHGIVWARVRVAGEAIVPDTACYVTVKLQQQHSTEESFPVGSQRSNRAVIIWGDLGNRTLGFSQNWFSLLLITFLVGGVGGKGQFPAISV